ncbi:MAG: UDP-N-acetyl-D-glucosamine/UDP-N-acetyl-D-galactosamine dehydrogenase [Sphingomonadales bacterium]|jgi:UDP-N-acetyl-D-galactosamine dehydrogenase|nr:UDP-N-acetyl-D-glucosamine/UDP-N-acetyl-D-galactosamine dehydrogenase [Sphingomonadales bacterium]
MAGHPRIVVIGLGYVGLPLAVALARNFDTIGFDIDEARVGELSGGEDRTREVDSDVLSASALKLTADASECAGADVYIVTVPTPVDEANRPDLTAVMSATRMLAGLIDPAKRPTIVYESTVYPGVTEEMCGPEIERVAGLKRGRDFRLGYSPERINPGDREHSIESITKVISGEDDEVVEQLAAIYGAVTSGGVFRAASIKAAEAAKAIENAQRDINIAFINEVTQIFSKIGVSVWDVLDAARTKWNFLGFEPGLVGGHCIGVDPYYLSHLAQRVGHDPQVILAGRQTNDGMGGWIADALHGRRGKAGSALVLGLTFKENVPDLRNSRCFDLVRRLQWLGHDVEVADPVASPQEIEHEHGLKVTEPNGRRFDLVIGAVAHRAYRELPDEHLAELVAPGGTLADLKGMWRGRALDPGVDRWTL